MHVTESVNWGDHQIVQASHELLDTRELHLCRRLLLGGRASDGLRLR